METLIQGLVPADAKQEAKRYIHDMEIPRLFECIMAGMLHHRPDDPVQFVQDCIDVVRFEKGVQLRWDMFIDWIPPAPRVDNPSRSASGLCRAESKNANDTPIISTSPLPTFEEDPTIFDGDSGIASAL